MTRDQIDKMAEYALKTGYALMKRRVKTTKSDEAARLAHNPDLTFSVSSVPGYILHIASGTVRRTS